MKFAVYAVTGYRELIVIKYLQIMKSDFFINRQLSIKNLVVMSLFDNLWIRTQIFNIPAEWVYVFDYLGSTKYYNDELITTSNREYKYKH